MQMAEIPSHLSGVRFRPALCCASISVVGFVRGGFEQNPARAILLHRLEDKDLLEDISGVEKPIEN